jgi:DNA-binding transcriptional ArsR family regulator
VTDDDLVFKALADPTRRFLLDQLFQRDGRTLSELEGELEMTRFGAMKHLRVLEDAGLAILAASGVVPNIDNRTHAAYCRRIVSRSLVPRSELRVPHFSACPSSIAI